MCQKTMRKKEVRRDSTQFTKVLASGFLSMDAVSSPWWGGSAFCTTSISQPFLPQLFPMLWLGPAPKSGIRLYFSGVGSQVQSFWALLNLWLRKVVLGRFTKVCEDQLFVLTHWHLVFRLISELWRTVYLETLCGASGLCFHWAVKGRLSYLKF